MVHALERAEPRHLPGAAHGYHAFTFGWLIGEIVQRVTGKRFGEVLAQELTAPLELDGLFIGLPADQVHRRARQIPVRRRRERPADDLYGRAGNLTRALRLARIPFDPQEAATALMPSGIERLDFNGEAFATASLPAANGMFTARSLGKLYAMLAGGGELEGVRLLSEERVERLQEPRNRGIGRVIPYPMHWRLGYHRVNTIRAKVRRGMGHAGFGGSGGWADPDRQLAVALVLNSGTGTPFGDLRIIRVGDAAIRCADRR
jgi:CubicO group peptidase (beta-lactamase class C family)